MSSQCGGALFSFVIATHTFSLLFLRRQWSDRASYIVFTISWALLSLQMCIENFILADPRKGQYYGVSGYWCWITPMYPTERYTTAYLPMLMSAVLSFVLHILVFLRLRGNITLSAGYKIGFQRRPKVRLGRTNGGTFIITDDQRVESYLTKVAKHMLWYPFAYTVLVLPMAASRYSDFSGKSVPFPVTITTAAVFMLHGLVNTLLFCTTRNILPGSWRQRLGLGTSWDSGRSDADRANRTNATWQLSTARIGSVSKIATSVAISNVYVEESIEIQYHGAQQSSSYFKVGSPLHASSPSPGSPTSPTPLLRAYGGGGQLAYTHRGHTRRLSFPTPRDAGLKIHTRVDEDDGDSEFGVGVDPDLNSKSVESDAPPQSSGHGLGGQKSGFFRPSSGIQTPTSTHPFSTTQPILNTDKSQPHSLSTPTSQNPVNLGRPPGAN